MCSGGCFGRLPKLKQASKAIFPPSPEAMDAMVWDCLGKYKLRVSCDVRFHLMSLTSTSAFPESPWVFVFRLWWSCSRCLLEFFKLYLDYASAILLPSTRYHVHDVTFAVALHTLSQDHVCATILPQSVCPARGVGLPRCGEHVRCISLYLFKFCKVYVGSSSARRKRRPGPFSWRTTWVRRCFTT